MPKKQQPKKKVTNKYTPEVKLEICKILAEGNTRHTAASLAGVSYDTFLSWFRKGEAGEEPYDEFYREVKYAEDEAIRRNLAIIQKAAEKSWQAAAWFLERKNPTDWGRKDRVDAALTGDVQIELSFKVPVGDKPVSTSTKEAASDADENQYKSAPHAD